MSGIKWCLPLVMMIMVSLNALSQRSTSWREQIDEMIEKTDSLSMHSQTTFYQVKYLKHDRAIKETWYYTLDEGKPVFFQLRYAIDNNEYTETYYLHKNRLVCMAEVEAPYRSKSEDINRGEVYFFNDDVLRQYVVSGPLRPNATKTSRQNECLEKFSQRMTELRANLR